MSEQRKPCLGCPVGGGCLGLQHPRMCELKEREDYRQLLLQRAGLAPVPDLLPVAAQHIDPHPIDPRYERQQAEIAETARLSQEVFRCPHRTEPDCGCSQVPGSCAIGKFEGKPTFRDCLSCRRNDGVLVLAHMNSFSGYGQHSIAIGKALEELGHPVLFDPLDVDDSFIPLDEFARKRTKIKNK